MEERVKVVSNSLQQQEERQVNTSRKRKEKSMVSEKGRDLAIGRRRESSAEDKKRDLTVTVKMKMFCLP
jgi:hypothetical protein